MKVETMKKIVCTILLAIMVVTVGSTVVMAVDDVVTPKDITANGANTSITTGTIDRAGRNLITILQAVGVVLSVVILIVIGIKYMMGSAEEKAEYKKTLMPYVIGAALIFAAAMFAQVLYDFFNNWTA